MDELSALKEAVDKLGESVKTFAKQARLGLKKVEDARYF